MSDRELGVTTVTITQDLHSKIKNYKQKNDCRTLHAAVADLYDNYEEVNK